MSYDPLSEVYIVERIMNKRINAKGRVEYYVKWLNFPEKDNTWEPIENFQSTLLIEQFERNFVSCDDAACSRMQPDKPLKKMKNPLQLKFPNIKNVPIEKVFGYQRGLELLEIVGVFPYGGRIFYIVHWDGLVEPDLVSSEEISLNNPAELIKFLESRVRRKK